MTTRYYPASVLIRLRELESSGIVPLSSLSHQKTILSNILQDTRISLEERERLALAVLDGEFGIQFVMNHQEHENLGGKDASQSQLSKSDSLFHNDYELFSQRFEHHEESNPKFQLVGSVASIPSFSSSELLQQQHNKQLYSAFASGEFRDDQDNDDDIVIGRTGGPGGGFCDGDKYHPVLAKPLFVSQNTRDLPRVGLTSANSLAIVTKRNIAERTKQEDALVRDLLDSRESGSSRAIEMTKRLKNRLSSFRKAINEYLREHRHPQIGSIMRCIDEGLAYEFLEKYHDQQMPVSAIVDLMTVQLGSDLLPPTVISPQKAFVDNDDGMIFLKSGSGSVVNSVVFEPSIEAVSTGYQLQPHTKVLRINENTAVDEHRQRHQVVIDLVVRKKGNSINNTPFLYPLPYQVSTATMPPLCSHAKPWNLSPIAVSVNVAGSGFRSKSPEHQGQAPKSPSSGKNSPKKSKSIQLSVGNDQKSSAKKVDEKKKGILLRRNQRPDTADELGEEEEDDEFEDDGEEFEDGELIDDLGLSEGLEEDEEARISRKKSRKIKKALVAEIDKHVEDLLLQAGLDTSVNPKSASSHLLAESAAQEQKFIDSFLNRQNSPPNIGSNELQGFDASDTTGRGMMVRSLSRAFKKSVKVRSLAASAKIVNGNTFLELAGNSSTDKAVSFTEQGLSQAVRQQNKDLVGNKLKSTKFLAGELKITKKDMEFSKAELPPMSDRLSDLPTKRSGRRSISPLSDETTADPSASLSVITDIVQTVAPLLVPATRNELTIGSRPQAESSKVSSTMRSGRAGAAPGAPVVSFSSVPRSTRSGSRSPSPNNSKPASPNIQQPSPRSDEILGSALPDLARKNSETSIGSDDLGTVVSESVYLTDEIGGDTPVGSRPPTEVTFLIESKPTLATPASPDMEPEVIPEGAEKLQKWIRPLLQPLAIRAQSSKLLNPTIKPNSIPASGELFTGSTAPATDGVNQTTTSAVAVAAHDSNASDDDKSTASFALPDRMYYRRGVLSISTLDSLNAASASQFLDIGEFDESAMPGAVQRPRTNSTKVPALLTKAIETLMPVKAKALPTEILSTRRPRRKQFKSEIMILERKTLSLRQPSQVLIARSGHHVGQTVYYGVEDSNHPTSLPMLERYKMNYSQSNVLSHENIHEHGVDEVTKKDSARRQQVAPIGSMALLKGVKHKKLGSWSRV